MSIDTTTIVEAADETEAVDAVLAAGADDLVVEELLVEEISIDGMCGVY